MKSIKNYIQKSSKHLFQFKNGTYMFFIANEENYRVIKFEIENNEIKIISNKRSSYTNHSSYYRNEAEMLNVLKTSNWFYRWYNGTNDNTVQTVRQWKKFKQFRSEQKNIPMKNEN